jgi:8-oxo-dGTP pyrophosphatase MutT (NUDIX family)
VHRTGILELLESYCRRFPDEESIIEQYRAFVTGHSDCFERSLNVGHVTGSAWLLDSTGTRALLTHHKKLDKWLQPGGHADGDSNVLNVCMKEALEESGLPAIRFVSRQLLDIDIHLIPARNNEPQHHHYDCRFLLQSAGSDHYRVSDESHDLCWAKLDEIDGYNPEISMARMARKSRLVRINQS